MDKDSYSISAVVKTKIEKELDKWLLIYALGWIVGVSIFGIIVWAFIKWYK